MVQHNEGNQGSEKRQKSLSPTRGRMRPLALDPIEQMMLQRGRSSTLPRNNANKRGGTQQHQRAMSAVEKERQEQIDRENRILLRKILEQHHGIRRQSVIPGAEAAAAGGGPQRHFNHAASLRQSGSPERSQLALQSNGKTSRQINQQRQKHKRDYENLLLLQKIQNVRPSRQIASSFPAGGQH